MNSRTADFDVIIAGYGPVGQVLAGLLGRQGHRVAVLERWPQLYARPRAAHLDHEIHRLLDQLVDLDELGDDLVAMTQYDWRGADGELILEIEARGVAESGFTVGHLFYQPALERQLDAAVQAASTVELMQGWAVQEVRRDGPTTTVSAERTDATSTGAWRGTGERRTLTGRYVVGADGANSRIRDDAGIAVDDLGFAEHWLVIDVALDAPAQAERLFAELGDSTQWCDPRRPHMSARIGGRHRRWEFMLLPGEHPEDFADASVVWKMLAPWITPEQARLERHVVYEFTSRLAAEMRAGPILLVGDAAHVMPPFLGQGLCSGFRDAANLAWKLDLVLRGVSDDALLDTLTPERYAQNKHTIESSLRMGRVSCTLDRDLARDRDLAFRDGRTPPPEAMAPLQGGVRYRPGGADVDHLAGTLGVQGRIRRGQRSGLADTVLGPGFCLIAAHGDPVTALTADDAATLHQLGASVVTLDPDVPGAIVDVDGRLTRWLASADVAAVLVRPDFYVFGTVDALDDLSRLIAALRSELRPPERAASLVPSPIPESA